MCFVLGLLLYACNFGIHVLKALQYPGCYNVIEDNYIDFA